jgi:drug/metabolite transporter (DMT)-like permease
VALGVIGLSVYNLLFFNGLRVYPGGKAGVLVTTTMPLFGFLLGRLINKEQVNLWQVIGLALGLSGGIFQAWPKDGFWDPWSFIFVLAAFFWAVLSLGSSRTSKSLGVMGFTFWVYGLSSLVMAILLLSQGIPWLPQAGVLDFWLNVVYLSVPAGVYGTAVYFAATKRLGSGSGSSSAFVVPVFAVLLSWLFFNEVPDIFTIAGGTISIAAISLIQWGTGQTGLKQAQKDNL